MAARAVRRRWPADSFDTAVVARRPSQTQVGERGGDLAGPTAPAAPAQNRTLSATVRSS